MIPRPKNPILLLATSAGWTAVAWHVKVRGLAMWHPMRWHGSWGCAIAAAAGILAGQSLVTCVVGRGAARRLGSRRRVLLCMLYVTVALRIDEEAQV